jgi:hypothetical protein
MIRIAIVWWLFVCSAEWTAQECAADEPLPAAVETAVIEAGDLKILFRDNSQSPKVLGGLDSLFHTKHAPDFDAFDPEGRGSSAGLNFEHIISGHKNPHNKFTPRSGRYTLHPFPDGRTIRLVRRAADEPWKVASTLTYKVVEPHYVDFEFRCTPTDAKLFGDRGWAIFFFANYMHDVAEVPIHFRAFRAAGAPEEWISADAPKGHADWNSGGTYRHVSAKEITYDADHDFRLNNWSYDWPRYSKPFYFGKAANGMMFELMFDRAAADADEIRFSLFKFKVPRNPRPAWDFQYVVHKVESGKEYGFKGRLVWKPFVSEADALREYEAWTQSRR